MRVLSTKKTSAILCALLLLASLFSCKEKDALEAYSNKPFLTEEKILPPDTHAWFYLSRDGFFPVDVPQNTPQNIIKPWTEAIHITASAEIGKKSWFLINRLGLLLLPTEANFSKENLNKNLYSDALLLSDKTALNLVSLEEKPVFHIYKNTFFSDSPITDSPFLIEFSPETKVFYPLLSVSDLDLPSKAQPTTLYFDGQTWTVAIKTTGEERVLFNYLKFSSPESLISLKSSKKKGKLITDYISPTVIIDASQPKNFNLAPPVLQKLLAVIPADYGFILEYSRMNFGTPLTFIRYGKESDPELSGKAFYGENFVMAIFSDGTTIFSGALSTKHILKEGKPIIFRLPKLPQDFTYSYFSVAGTVLYVAWEESHFYETGRNGILAVDLEKVLYK